ncbi:PAS domain S-box protein, partial [Streptomyces sp. 796.1]|uniref:PAS domain S-box protein n=1 Tax=Streptomyces sp. 796.1 TaxID=3163029 RepID=UPI0039C926BA
MTERNAPLSEYRAAFHAAHVAMAVVDHEGVVRAANAALGALLGAAPEQLAGTAAADLADLREDPRLWGAYREVLRGRHDRLRCTRRLRGPDGRSRWVEITVVPLVDEHLLPAVPAPDTRTDRRAEPRPGPRSAAAEQLPEPRELRADRRTDHLPDRRPEQRPEQRHGPRAERSAAPRSVLLTVVDVSEQHDLQARLRHLQMHDPVTRLPNRSLFFERLASALEAATGGQGGVQVAHPADGPEPVDGAGAGGQGGPADWGQALPPGGRATAVGPVPAPAA